MKKQILKFSLWTFLTTVLCFTGCKEETTVFTEVDGQNPTIELTTEHIRSEFGKQFTLTGKISDKDGLKSIQLVSPELELDRTIDLLELYEEIKYEYELSYKFTMPEKADVNEFSIKVIVTDVGGRTTEHSVVVTPDGDSTAPVISDVNPADKTVYILLEENKTIHDLSFKVTDDKGLGYVTIVIPELNVNKTIEVEEGKKEIVVDETFELLHENKEYNVEIQAVDLLANVQTYSYKIVAAASINYEQMYLVDFENNDDLALYAFGSHATMTRVAAYTYKATYFSHGGSKIRFTVSNANFDICYGESTTNSGVLTKEANDVKPIEITEKGYYDIIINILNLSYAVDKITPSVTDYGQLTVYGKNFIDITWSDSSPTVMTQDLDYKSIYSIDLDTDDSQGGYFCLGITNAGWVNGWKYYDDIKKFASMNDFSKGEMIGGYLPGYGVYRLVFDTYLERGYLKKIQAR